MKSKELFSRIKQTVIETDPGAKVILFGSFARGENKLGSDIDLLILTVKKNVSYEDEKRIKYPLYDIEFETGQIISPIIMSVTDWNTKHRISPFYHNVELDGKLL